MGAARRSSARWGRLLLAACLAAWISDGSSFTASRAGHGGGALGLGPWHDQHQHQHRRHHQLLRQPPSPRRGGTIVMGVPGGTVWLRKTFPGAFTEVGRDQQAGLPPFDHIYVDVNDVLHTTIRRANDQEHMFKILYQKFNSYLFKLRPTQSVVIAVDGPAPLAKLLLQRRRRMKSANEKAKRKPRKGKRGGPSRGNENAEGVSSLTLTPGTKLMMDLEDALVAYARSKASHPRNSRMRFVVSAAQTPGEGEVKLLGCMYDASKRAGIRSVKTRHCMVGGDSDLIFMALAMGTMMDTNDVHVLSPRWGGGGSGSGGLDGDGAGRPQSTLLRTRR